MQQNIIEIQGRMFRVKRKFPEHRIDLTKGNIKDLKEYFYIYGHIK